MVADFSKKQKGEFFNERLLFKTIGAAFLVVIVVLVVMDIRIYQKKQKLVSQISSYQKQIEDLSKSSQTLKEQIANSDNKDYLEKVAYEQLGQQRPGEKEIIFVTPPKKLEAPQKSEDFLISWTGWVSNAWQWIKNKF
jgi:cell division protein FtsB